MDILVRNYQDPIPVTVLIPNGPLDASTYGELIEAAQLEYEKGARNMIVDMSEINYMSSAGIVAIHTITKLLQGIPPSQEASGYEATKALIQSAKPQHQERFKLVAPKPQVERTLEMVGFKKFVPVYPDLESAISSFGY